MKNTRHTAFVIILLFAGIPLSIALVVLILFAARGHEAILENQIEDLLGLNVDVQDLETADIDRFTIRSVNVGHGLFKLSGIEIQCSFDPFILRNVAITEGIADLTGVNMDRLDRMLATLQARRTETPPQPFRVILEKGLLKIAVREKTSADIAFSPLTVHSADGKLVQLSMLGVNAEGASAGPLRLGADFDIASASGGAQIEGNAAALNAVLPPEMHLRDAAVKGVAQFSFDDPDTLGLDILLRDQDNQNDIRAAVRFSRDFGRIEIPMLQTHITKAFRLLAREPSDYIRTSGGPVLGRAAIVRDSETADMRIDFHLDITSPEIAFLKDLEFDDQVLYLSRIGVFRSPSLLVHGDLAYTEKDEDTYQLSTSSITGKLGHGELFWNVAGELNIDGVLISSDISADLYQLPLETAGLAFKIFDADHGWIDRMDGPVDVCVCNFDISRPDRTPILFNSGNRGLNFWLADSEPRIDGIHFNSLKLYLPPLEQADEKPTAVTDQD